MSITDATRSALATFMGRWQRADKTLEAYRSGSATPSNPSGPYTPQEVDQAILDAMNAGEAIGFTGGAYDTALRVPQPERILPLPVAELRAGLLLAFNSAGDPILVQPATGSATEVMVTLAAADGASKIGASVPGVPDTTQRDLLSLVELDVRHFAGVDPTGATESSVGINNYIRYVFGLRNIPNAITGPMKLRFPRGIYLAGNLNMTNIVARQTVIDFDGSTFIASVPGKPVFDCMDSRWLRFKDGTIFSPEAGMARCGIQLGNSQDLLTVGNNYLDNMFIVGWFTHAAYYNLGSETTATHACNFENRNRDPDVYAAIYDGMSGKFYPESDYRTVTRTPGRSVSFTNNGASGSTQFRNAGGGTAIFCAGTAGFTFDDTCYALSLNDAAIELYSTGSWRNKGLIFNVQFENSQNNNPTPGNVGIRYCFKFTTSADSTSTAIDGLKCDTFGAQCEDAMFYNATGGLLRISNLDLRMSNMHGDGQQNVFDKGAGTMLVDGSIYLQEAAKLNLGELEAFSGLIHVDNAANLPSRPPAGAYTITDRINRTYEVSAAVGIWNRTSGSAQVSIGNSAANYITVQGGSVYPQLRAQGPGADVDLALVPKGAGKIRMGAYVPGSSAIIGSMTVKDSSGVERKLAVLT